MQRKISLATLAFVSILATSVAHAQDSDYSKSNWPLSFSKRPLVLAPGMLELRGDTLKVNLSDGSALEPVSLAPDLFVGLNKSWTVGITHDRGICLTGTDGGCARAYDDAGLEVQFRLMGRGTLLLSATGGASISSMADPFVAGLDFGFQAKIRTNKYSLLARPRLYVGLAKRDVLGDTLDVPFDFHYQLNTQTAVALETGLVAPLDDLSGGYHIPVGMSGLFAVNEKLDMGLALRMPELIGNGAGFDARELVARLALRL